MQRQRSASTKSAFIAGDEVKWIALGGEEDSGWVTRVFPLEEKCWILHPDGTFKEVPFGDLHLVARFPVAARGVGALCVQSLGSDPSFDTKPNLDDTELPQAMKSFIESMARSMPMSRNSFVEFLGRLVDLQGVFTKIDELEDHIGELSKPDKNVNWLHQQRRQHENTIENLNQDVAELRSDKDDLEEKVGQLESMNAKFVGSYKQFLEQKELLVNTSQKLDDQKKMLERQLAEEKALTAKLMETGGNQEAFIAALSTQKSDFSRELEDTKGLYKEEIRRRENCEVKIANLEKTNADLLSQLEVMVSANRELQQGFREWRIQNQDIFAQLKNLSSRKVPNISSDGGAGNLGA